MSGFCFSSNNFSDGYTLQKIIFAPLAVPTGDFMTDYDTIIISSGAGGM